MILPRIVRPHFPPGYVDHPETFVAWEHAEQRLVEAKNYWLCSTRPNGHPHAIPKWAVWVTGRLYFDGSPATRHARNLAANPQVTVHLESGDAALILDGVAQALTRPDPSLAQAVAQAYRAKYAALGYAPEANQWDNGGLYDIAPRHIIAWTTFFKDPTKFVFD